MLGGPWPGSPPHQAIGFLIATARLQKLVNSLLDFSRIEAGRIQAAYVPTDLASLTSDLVGVFCSAVESAGLHL